MAKIPQEAQELFAKVDAVVFATARADAQPNGCIVAMKKVIDDETVYLSDQFFKKTLANIQENPKVSVIWWGDEGAYELYGTARYVNEGPEFEEQAAWVNAAFEQMGMPVTAKGGVYVDVEAVYSSSPGPSAGAQIA
jgi:predicted pyridoxine 5'-phosphate oxidase superfamily flavin-nucleotide-binding protein